MWEDNDKSHHCFQYTSNMKTILTCSLPTLMYAFKLWTAAVTSKHRYTGILNNIASFPGHTWELFYIVKVDASAKAKLEQFDHGFSNPSRARVFSNIAGMLSGPIAFAVANANFLMSPGVNRIGRRLAHIMLATSG